MHVIREIMVTLEANFSTPSNSEKAKRQVAKATFEKWQRELEKDHGMMTRL